MLKFFLYNKKGVISWLLSQLALILATGILLASIASITFYSDWKKEAEIKAIAAELASWIYRIDLKIEENITKFFFPTKDFYYNVSISTDYIIIERYDGRFKDKIRIAYPLFIKPFVIKENLDIDWKNGEELHEKLSNLELIENRGTINDPILSYRKDDTKNYLKNILDELAKELALQPLQVNINKPLIIEKCIIYFDDSSSIGLVIIYQEEG